MPYLRNRHYFVYVSNGLLFKICRWWFWPASFFWAFCVKRKSKSDLFIEKNIKSILDSVFSSCTSAGPGCSCTSTTVTSSSSCTPCSRTGSDYSYSETLSPLTNGRVTNATVRTITISGCPNHAFTDYTPNTACKGTLTMTVPALPGFVTSTSNSLSSTGGTLKYPNNHIHIIYRFLFHKLM